MTSSRLIRALYNRRQLKPAKITQRGPDSIWQENVFEKLMPQRPPRVPSRFHCRTRIKESGDQRRLFGLVAGTTPSRRARSNKRHHLPCVGTVFPVQNGRWSDVLETGLQLFSGGEGSPLELIGWQHDLSVLYKDSPLPQEETLGAGSIQHKQSLLLISHSSIACPLSPRATFCAVFPATHDANRCPQYDGLSILYRIHSRGDAVRFQMIVRVFAPREKLDIMGQPFTTCSVPQCGFVWFEGCPIMSSIVVTQLVVY